MSRFGPQMEERSRELEELVRLAGPENLVGCRLFASLTLDGRRLYEVQSYDEQAKVFMVKDVLTGKEPSAIGSPLREFEIGLASRGPDDPLVLLLERHRIPVTPFIRRESEQAPGSQTTTPRDSSS